MSRKVRFILPGVPQHVIQRGNNRSACFFKDDDYRRYRYNLQESAEKNRAQIHAYVLMTNHVHLLVTPSEPHSITHMMQDLGRKFVRYINRTYQRTGSLWEGRFKASLVDSDGYLLTCMRYIEMNPVRAGMVNHPGDYRWSSYAANADGQADPLVHPHSLYQSLDETGARRRRAYRALFRQHPDTDALHAIRQALNQELVLGSEAFKDYIGTLTKRPTRHGKPGRPRVEAMISTGYSE